MNSCPSGSKTNSTQHANDVSVSTFSKLVARLLTDPFQSFSSSFRERLPILCDLANRSFHRISFALSIQRFTSGMAFAFSPHFKIDASLCVMSAFYFDVR